MQTTPLTDPLDLLKAVQNIEGISPAGGTVVRDDSKQSSINLDDAKHKLSFTTTDIFSEMSMT